MMIDERKCPAVEQICKAIPACPREVIRYEQDDSLPLGGRILFDEERCDDCGICIEACCGQAIT